MVFKKIISVSLSCISVFLYFRYNNVVTSSVKEALYICYDTLIPSLFIFMVITSIIADTKFSEILCTPLFPFFRLLKISDKKIATYCILGLLGGFANGGNFLNRISQEYTADKNLIKILSLITSLNSPAFIISVIGLKMLGNVYTGIMLYASVIVSAYISAFLLSFTVTYSHVQHPEYTAASTVSVTDSVSDSVVAMINVCGIFILAKTACNVVQLYTRNSLVLWVLSAFTEVTSACFYVKDVYADNIYIYCITLCIFPLSAALQMKSFFVGHDINFRLLLISKIIQIPFAVFILRILVNVFPVIASVYSSTDIRVANYWHSPRLSLYTFILSICFVIMFDKKVGVFTKKQ